MKTPSKKDWLLLAAIGLIFIIIGWSAKGVFTKPQVNIPAVDTMKYVKAIDTLIKDKASSQLKVKELERTIDSLIAKKKVNHSNLNHNINVIKKFTNTARHRWNDSVLRANGIR